MEHGDGGEGIVSSSNTLLPSSAPATPPLAGEAQECGFSKTALAKVLQLLRGFGKTALLYPCCGIPICKEKRRKKWGQYSKKINEGIPNSQICEF